MIMVNYCSEDDIMLYRMVRQDLQTATNNMREFHLFLPYEPFEQRVRLALPRLPQNGMLYTGEERVPTQTDAEVAAEGWGWLPEPIGLQVAAPDSDMDSLATESS